MLSSSRSDSNSTTGSNINYKRAAKAFHPIKKIYWRKTLPDIQESPAETDISDVPDRSRELSNEADRNMNDAGQEPNQPNM